MKNTKIYCFNLEKWLTGENKELFFYGNCAAGKSFLAKKLSKYFNDSNIVEDIEIEKYFLSRHNCIKSHTIIASNLSIYYHNVDITKDSIIFVKSFSISLFFRRVIRKGILTALKPKVSFNLYEKQFMRFYKNESKILGKQIFCTQQLFTEIQAYLHR